MSVFEHPEFDQHEQVVFCHDHHSGLNAIIAIHNTNLGPALGGCRMWPYADSQEALTDVLRLSKGMTYKSAIARVPLGGGKAVIIGNAREHKNAEMMKAMGRYIESLSGRYYTAEDSGISVADLQLMASQSQYITGTKARYHVHSQVADGNPAPSTAYGVFVGLKASVEYALNTDLKGIRVAIQGLGQVGYRLAKHLHEAGAELVVTDIFPESLQRAEQEFGATVVAADDIFKQQVDVFAPCAMGAVLNEKTVSQLSAKVVAGAANNQLATENVGALLVEKDILYAPDYVINAGGIIDIHHQRLPESSDAALRTHVEQIGTNLLEIFARATTENKATNQVANAIAEELFANKA